MQTKSTRGYEDLALDTATEPARTILAATAAQFGFVPSAMARMALAPALVRAFQQGLTAFERTSFTEIEREVAVVAMAVDVACEVCVAIHRRALVRASGEASVAPLLARADLADARLDALAKFMRALLATKGDVDGDTWSVFLAAGYTRAQALELLVGIGAYTMSTYANRLTEAAVDPQLA